MPLVPIEYREFLRKLRQLVFFGPFQVGRHPFHDPEKTEDRYSESPRKSD